MRRLPVYLLIDVSESMAGQPIREVAKGLDAMTAELRNDPYALETVFLSLIAFAGKAEVLNELTELVEFKPALLPIGSGTDLGSGLKLLMDRIDRDVQPTTAERKGDWKPIIFLFTDGAPTTDASASVERWQRHYRDKCNIVSITFGKNADVPLLEKLGPQVLTLNDASPASFREFFKWVSASLQVSSMAVSESGQDGIKLADCRINLEKAVPSSRLDENFVILSMKCSKNKKMWLAKYDSRQGAPWPLLETCPVEEESYQRLSAGGKAGSVDIKKLEEIAICPECGDDSIVLCNKCGKLSCAGIGSDRHVCPWCGSSGRLKTSDNFAVDRNAG